jgi:hypothetical protein
MARHGIDPVLQQMVRAISESGQASVPVTMSFTARDWTVPGGHGDGRRESPPAVPLFRGRARPVSQLA